MQGGEESADILFDAEDDDVDVGEGFGVDGGGTLGGGGGGGGSSVVVVVVVGGRRWAEGRWTTEGEVGVGRHFCVCDVFVSVGISLYGFLDAREKGKVEVGWVGVIRWYVMEGIS